MAHEETSGANVDIWHHLVLTRFKQGTSDVKKWPDNKIRQLEEALQLFDPVLLAITSRTEGDRGGLIATFVSNASIVPDCPRLMVGIARQHHTWSLIENSNSCAVHLLGRHQLDWVWKLGTRTGKQVDKLADFDLTHWVTGAPVLSEAIAAFDCQVEARFDTGDRTIYLLEVLEARKMKDELALRFSDLWKVADQEQRSLLNRLLQQDQQLDRAAICRWRGQRREHRQEQHRRPG